MAQFDPAVSFTLTLEGGYVNNPKDPGGETNFGISKRAFPDVDIKNLTIEQAQILYRTKYWSISFDQLTDQDNANKIFDMTVNFGPTQGIMLVQKSLRVFTFALVVDGKFGPDTVKQINLCNPHDLLIELRVQSAQFYYEIVQARPSQAPFLHGWLRRACQ